MRTPLLKLKLKPRKHPLGKLSLNQLWKKRREWQSWRHIWTKTEETDKQYDEVPKMLQVTESDLEKAE